MRPSAWRSVLRRGRTHEPPADVLISEPSDAAKDLCPHAARQQAGGIALAQYGGWQGESHGGSATEAPPVTPELSFEPGAELARAFEGVAAALRSETARMLASQAEAAQKQTAELLDKARQEADELVQNAAKLHEAATTAVEKAAGRYESILRIIGQLSGGLSEIRELATAEYEAIRRLANEGTHDATPSSPTASEGEEPS
jgi:hypothetical protein